MFLSEATWAERRYYLNKMSLRDLIHAYVSHPAIQVYALLGLLSAGVALWLAERPLPLLIAALVPLLIFPLVEYLLHRFVLHGSWLYRLPQTAALWKRVHFDHHQNPSDMAVLFGALRTTLPTIVVMTIPLGWLIAGPAGAAAAFSAGVFTTAFYEFCHCIQHLKFTPRLEFLRQMKKRHLAHHFHNEQGNYGITSCFCDQLLGTFYPEPKTMPRSETVFNLGYTGEERRRFPWVAELSPGSSDERGGTRVSG